MTQTAVEWLIEQFSQPTNLSRRWDGMIEQAKQMEKEQLDQAYENGHGDGYNSGYNEGQMDK